MAHGPEIEALLATYASSFDAGDASTAASVFAQDARMSLSIGDQGVVGKWEGRDAIQLMLQGAVDAQQPGEQRRHHVSGIRVIATDPLVVASVILVTRAIGQKVDILTSGSQVDDMVDTSSGLRITSRALHVDVPF